MIYVTDTHSLVWYFTEDKHLSRKAFDAFESTIREGVIIIPSIVLAEIIYIYKKGRINLSFKETLQKLDYYNNFEIIPLNVEILKTVDSFNINMEMHDKIIVATALNFKAGLITKDEDIKKSGIVSVVW